MVKARLLRLAVLALIGFITLIAASPRALHAVGQQPRLVSGLVEIEDNGRRVPVRRAAVTLTNDGATLALKTFTDNDGRFRFSNVAPGRIRVEAAKPGFLQLQPLSIGETESNIDIRMQWAAALEGRFIEDTGKPIAGLAVLAESTSRSGSYTATTDDLGRFRIHTIPPGQYRVYATPPPPASGTKRFYPGTETPENASVVTVVSGQTLDNLMVIVPTAPLSAIAAEALATAELEATSAPTGGGTWGQISGRVTRTDSGGPIVNAAVKLLSGSGGALLRTAWTNGDGGYVFTRVMAGSYHLTAAADGHVSPSATPARPSGTSTGVSLGDGGKLKQDLELIPLSAIEGRVLDEFGDGVPDVKLQVTQRATTPGDAEARFLPVRSDRPVAATDDRGWFRASQLAPGDYYLVAIPPPFAPGPATVPFPFTYFPGTTSSSAANTVRISAGIDAHGVNLTLRNSNTTTITGIAVDPRGRSQNTSIRLLPVEDGQTRVPASLNTTADDMGRFSFPPIPEGSYVLQAGGGGAVGSTVITVTDSSGPEQNVRFTLQPLGTLRGRLTFEGGLPAARDSFYVRLLPADFIRASDYAVAIVQPSASVNPDFTFSMKNIAWPGVIRMAGIVGESGWALVRVLLQGRDITDTPYDFHSGDTEGVEVVLTNRIGGITGSVIAVDDTVKTVLIFGAESESSAYIERTQRVAPISKTGDFRFPFLLPGRYFVVAAAPSALSGPNKGRDLRSLATLVVVTAGSDASVRLTVVK